MTSVSPNVYPSVPRDAETYRLEIADNIQKDLSIFMNPEKALAVRQEKKLDRFRQATSWLGFLGTAASLAGGTIDATGVGVIPGRVLIGVGVILGAGSIVASKLEGKILKKLMRHDKLASLAEAKLFSLHDKISNALKDGKISEEFKEINEEIRKHAMQRSDILNETKKLSRQTKNGDSLSTRELADQLALALKTLKRSSTSS